MLLLLLTSLFFTLSLGQEFDCDSNNPDFRTFACSNDGSSFQICLFPGNIQRECPEGMVCSDDLRACTPPPIVTTTDSVTTTVPGTNDFQCTGVGYYPDPFVCTKYHLCKAANTTSEVYTCPDNYVYYTKLSKCHRGAPCTPVDCTVNPNQPLKQFNAYLSHQHYFVDCSQTPPTITRCPVGSYFDVTAAACVYRCWTEGDFVDTENPNGFFRCYFSGIKLVSKHLLCPFGWVFHGFFKICTKP